jgi:hypothetical protein
METKEKNLEQDIESWLLNEGGYVKDRSRGSCDHLLKIRFLTLKNANLFVFSSLNRNFPLSLQKN